MKKLIILVLILLVLGLYYYTAQTKEVISAAATKGTEVGSKLVEKGVEAAEDKVSQLTDSNKDSTG